MMTIEIRQWLKKVENRQSSFEDAIYELNNFAKILTKDELIFIKNRIIDSYKNYK